MDDVTRLEQIAAQLVGRIRDDDPESNGRWLELMTTPAERWALLFVLAAAVPDDRPWSSLTRWTLPDSPQAIAERRRQLSIAMRADGPSGRHRQSQGGLLTEQMSTAPLDGPSQPEAA